jgi:hypothetical protein
MTASAASSALFSAHAETSAPRPSCSRFHGRSGSIECAVATSGMPWTSRARRPPKAAYQVCEWTTSASVGWAARLRQTRSARTADV